MDSVAPIIPHTKLQSLLTLARECEIHFATLFGLRSLVERAGDLTRVLASISEIPSLEETRRLCELIEGGLEALRDCLKSLTPRYQTIFTRRKSYRKTLEQCGKILDLIMTHVIAFKDFGTTRQHMLTSCQTLTAMSTSSVGLDRRAMPVTDFLTSSEAQALRVICICGMAGVGKSTLLCHLWSTVSAKSPFLERIFVNIGHDATEASICRLQASIVHQLEGRYLEFPTRDFGKEALTRCFKRLKVANRPIFLAIDDVFLPSDVDSLLPWEPAVSNLPVKSCIALTCRDFRVAESLIAHCRLQATNVDQVLCYTLPFLTTEEGKRIFTACAGMQQVAPENHELLDTLVPLCNGLPLALTVLGNVFADQRMWARKEWQDIGKEMITMAGAVSMTVTKSLQISYDLLEQPQQALFLDAVELFYGWPWEVVEGIVGKQLKNLEKSCLISQVATLKQCNQNAMLESTIKILDYFGLDRRSNRVWMHELTLEFGRSILNDNRMGYRRRLNQNASASQLANIASSLRCLVVTSNVNVTELPVQLADASSLQLLAVIRSPLEGCTFAASYVEKSSSSHQDEAKLRYLMLGELNGLDSTILEAKVSPEIRGIYLIDCRGITYLPQAFPLQELQDLTIQRCPAFWGFTSHCVRGWCNLKRLYLCSVPIVRIPMELGSLPKLQSVQILSCRRLEEFPPMTNAEQLLELGLSDCPVLKRMGHISCPLENLYVSRCLKLPELPDFRSLCLETFKTLILDDLPQLLSLPSSICSMMALKHLELVGCETLVNLPHNIGVLPSLETLVLWHCNKLHHLPNSICRMKALKVLDVKECKALVDLPDDIAGLLSLEKLRLRGCKKLQRLSSSMCSMMSLKELDLTGCGALVDLPDNIGDLLSLEILTLSCCTKLQWLPSSMCSMMVLNELDLTGCEALVDLPVNIGKLPSLRRFLLQGCTNLRQLPSSMCSMMALKELDLRGCEALVDLPDNIGDLDSLEKLRLEGGAKLWRLPSSGCSMIALKELDLIGCEALVELPHIIGLLPSLGRLWLQGCSNLRQLPSSMCSMIALKELDLRGCEALVDLPDNIGDLHSLEKLRLEGGANLRQLPSSMCSMMALKELDLIGCEALVDLPDNIGHLPSLIFLLLQGCMNLRQLPSSMCGMTALKKLDFTGCEALVELPNNFGDLLSLETLRLRRCRKLQRLPSSMCRMMALRELDLRGCKALVNLPDNIGDLSSLEKLRLGGDTKLQQLPNSMCSMMALKELDLAGCEALVDLPDNIGSLPSLIFLWLQGCTKLQQLPSSMCSIMALKELDLAQCEALVDLPDDIGDLLSVEKVSLRCCTKLRRLCSSMCRMMSLKELDLTGCEALVDLPHNIGDLPSMELLTLTRCTNLQWLPSSMCYMRVLNELDLTGCESLVGLPDNIGDLQSLRRLLLQGCTKLRQLPSSMCSMMALMELDLAECEGLVDLPDDIGDLPSLEKLRLRFCTKLQWLPSSICSMMALRELDLTGCEALVGLPDKIGNLPSLRRLWLHGCKNLGQLPSSMCSMTGLKELDLRGCEALVDLPDDIGHLPSLRRLWL